MTALDTSSVFSQVANEYRSQRGRVTGYFAPELAGRAADLSFAMKPLHEIAPVMSSNYLVKGWIDRGSFSVVYGESNVGKTFFALDLAMHIAARVEWYGHKVAGLRADNLAGPVVYVAGEGGRGINNRIEAIRRERSDLTDRIGTDFLLLTSTIDLCGPSDADALSAACADLHDTPSLIVIDTLARAMGEGDENTAKDMGAFVKNCDILRENLGCHVMVIHHSGKDSGRGARGSSSLYGAIDTELHLTRADNIVTVTQSKQRDMLGDKVFSYSLRTVELGIDEDGDPITSAVVEQAEYVKPQVRLVGAASIAMQALSDAIAHHGEQKGGDMFPLNRHVVTLERWREYCDRHSLTSGEGDSAKRTAFMRAKAKLQEKELVKIIDEYVWRVLDD
jgi:hypothetical protein